MPYSQFTLQEAVERFNLSLVDGEGFLTAQPIEPSATLAAFLQESLPLTGSASEKARSESIIYPVLLEVKRILQPGVSLFSGEEFNVDSSMGLNGVCDFILSRSAERLLVQAPVVMMVEAKKADLTLGLGQCVAEMVAAQRFNEAKQQNISTIYGCISSGTQWRFLQLNKQIITIDLIDYPLPPVPPILGLLVRMVSPG
ncbi:MAG: hypothetical protein ACFB4I_02695 [Cyanophyceae cyanobacterium]